MGRSARFGAETEQVLQLTDPALAYSSETRITRAKGQAGLVVNSSARYCSASVRSN